MANRNHLLALPMTSRMDHWKKDLRRLLDSDPFRVAADLEAQYYPLNILHDICREANLLFFNRFEWDDPLPENGVLADYTAMTCHTLKHFLDRGHRKIVFLGHRGAPRPFKRRELARAGELYGLEFGSEAFDYCCRRDFENNPKRIQRIFGAKEPPTAIFSRSDGLLFNFMQKIRAFYPRLGDVELVGCYNTKNSQIPQYEFSSYDMQWHRAWDVAIRKKNCGTEWCIPKMIVREKTVLL